MAKPDRRRLNALRREREKLLGEMSSLALLIRGSYFERFSTCSRPNCRCHEGQRHGPRGYLVVTEGKRQRQHYVPRSQEAAAQQAVEQYHRLLDVIARITAINLELMRRKALDEDLD
jgi:hypothetical protein